MAYASSDKKKAYDRVYSKKWRRQNPGAYKKWISPEENRKKVKEWQEKNPKRTQTNKRKYKLSAKGKKRARSNHLMRLYGITVEDEERMIVKQGFKCAICKRQRRLIVDHSHITGKVRGLLCIPCNTALGAFLDGILIPAVQKYLEK